METEPVLTLTCTWCSQPFERKTFRGPTPQYCSDSHRQAAYQRRRLNKLEVENASLRSQLAAVKKEAWG